MTMNSLGDVKLARHPTLQAQIAELIRDAIRVGRWKPNERIPTTRELAVQWRTDPATVHHALRMLVREGLLMRRRRAGTFVRKRAEKLTRVGIYYYDDIWMHPRLDYLRALHASLKEHLVAQGAELITFMDSRPRAEGREKWGRLEEAVDRGEIHGIVAPRADPAHLRWLVKLPAPTVFMASARLPNVVGYNLRHFAELAVGCLARQGCRSVGLICAMTVGSPGHQHALEAGTDFYEHFLAQLQAHGLPVRDVWMRVARHKTLEPEEHEPFGYQAFRALWRLKDRPDGVIVYPDSMVNGVLMSALESGVRPSSPPRLVLHRNEGVPLYSPLPANYVESSEREAAKSSWDQLQDQYNGKAVQPILLPFRLRERDAGGAR
jgi:DNA-binding transcriptional regulator YhcF (GntR family)